MKKLICFVLIFVIFTNLSAQEDNRLEKSIFNVQAGILGIWLNNELRLSDNFTLKSEVGLVPYYIKSTLFDLDEFGLAPTIGVEPRFYYNINRRIDKEKQIRNNSANFIGLKIGYVFDSDIFKKKDSKIEIVESMHFIPNYGLKRNFSTTSNFNYEFNVGIGLRYDFLKQYGYTENKLMGTVLLKFAVGYHF